MFENRTCVKQTDGLSNQFETWEGGYTNLTDYYYTSVKQTTGLITQFKTKKYECIILIDYCL